MSPRVLIVDDHTMLSQALAEAFSLHGITEVRVAAPHELGENAVLAVAEEWLPTVVLLDLYLGGRELGTTLLPALHSTGAAVIVLTACEDRSVWGEALEAGAAGVLPKSVAFDELVAAVHRADCGEAIHSAAERFELLDRLARSRRAEHERRAPFERLTRREQQVLEGLIDGRAPRDIAAEFGVSLPTVRAQIRNLFDKLGVNSQRAAVALARRAEWEPDKPE